MSPALIPVSAKHFESVPEHVRHLFQVIQVSKSEPVNPTTDSQSSLAPPSLFLDSHPAAVGLVSESTNPPAPEPPVSDTLAPEPPASVLADTPVPEPVVSDSSTGSVLAFEDAVMESGDSGNPVSGKPFFYFILV